MCIRDSSSNSSLKSGSTLLKGGSTMLKGGATRLGKSKMGGGTTKLGEHSKRFGGGRTIKGPTTTNTESLKDERVVTPGGTDRTPKILITPEFLQETQALAAALQEAKASKAGAKAGVKQSSVFDSSMKGQNSSSQEKSSDSIKMSSSNLGYNQSSFQDSKRSDQTDPSEDDSNQANSCLLYTSPSPRDRQKSRMPSSA
eukprot:TRINITY_DN6267_c0_g1_i5.p2 TRINITY_DN6267_c0_g1~~TRINITY_DN6267_c0_g1_i5.p2  ORF type:complete len:199 (-),score=40.77 TRINITY_DN6267_c0_g1_i5:12-608(-)